MNESNAARRALKAYTVTDDFEGYGSLQFARHAVVARRNGADDLGVEFEYVTCRRSPEFDTYAPGPVPPLVMIENGWSFECGHCGRRVWSDMADDLESDGFDPADFTPVMDRSIVFCSAACMAADHERRRKHDMTTAAMTELVETLLPGAEVVRVTVCDGYDYGRGKHTATFRFPGGQYPAEYRHHDSAYYVAASDHAAFSAAYPGW